MRSVRLRRKRALEISHAVDSMGADTSVETRAIAAASLLLVHAHGETLATLPSAVGEHLAATAGLEAGTESVGTGTAPTAGLIGALHCEYSNEISGAGK